MKSFIRGEHEKTGLDVVTFARGGLSLQIVNWVVDSNQDKALAAAEP